MKRLLQKLLGTWKQPIKKKSFIPHQTTYDLQAIYHKINEKYFQNQLNLSIRWSKRRTSLGRRSRRLGSYCLKTGRILIDGRLDHPHFPEEFIAFIVYHEMLHSTLPPLQTKSGRRSIHHPAFRSQERQFERYDEIKKWEKEHSHLFFT